MPIYVVRFGSTGPVKIGYSRAVGRRMAELGPRLWDEFHLLRVLAGTDADERALHRRFIHLHIKYEWFHYHPDMMGDLGLADITSQRDAVLGKLRDNLLANEDLRIRSESLRAWMIEEGLSEHQLAPLVSHTSSTVAHWLRHGNLPRKAACLKLIELSGGKLAHAFGREAA